MNALRDKWLAGWRVMRPFPLEPTRSIGVTAGLLVWCGCLLWLARRFAGDKLLTVPATLAFAFVFVLPVRFLRFLSSALQ
jgi:hypothetical protein